jgi:hypothetical protein
MPRGATLRQVVDEVRRKAGHSTHPGIGNEMLEPIKDDVRRVYRWLHASWDWPHLMEHWADKTLSAGARVYDFPSDIEPDSINDAYHREAGTDLWEHIEYGIDHGHYNVYPQGDRSDPVRRWQRRNEHQFEVWPTPSSDGGTIEFVGPRPPKALTDENDTLDLDTDLVVLYVAGEMLAERQSPSTQRVFQQAADRFRLLKGNSQVKSRYADGGASDRGALHDPVRVRIPRR